MKITVERVVIIVLLVALVFKSCQRATADCPPVETTVIEHKTTTTVDSARNPGIKDQEPEKLQVIEEQGKVERVKDITKLPDPKREKVKTINRYLDTTRLKGAVIVSEILSEGRVLEHNVIAEIEHWETTITKTIVERPGGLFISPGIDYSPIKGVEAIEATLTYIKGPLGISVGPYYNFRTISQVPNAGSLGFKLKIHIKL